MNDNQILISKIKNLIVTVERGRLFAFSEFLNFEEQRIVKDYVTANGLQCLSFGGYQDSERAIIGVYSEYKPDYEDFPITAVYFKIPQRVSLSHRDILGALMSLGIKRELFGDIIFFDDLCVFFAENKIVDFIIQNFNSAKNCSVNVAIFEKEIKYTRSFEEITVITSSMRLDCVVSEILSVSRTVSSELVESGFVFVNGSECLKKDKIIVPGDILSVRKKGKFRIDEQLGRTKKDRIKLKILKYI